MGHGRRIILIDDEGLARGGNGLCAGSFRRLYFAIDSQDPSRYPSWIPFQAEKPGGSLGYLFFLPFRERYNFMFEVSFQDIFIDPRKSSTGVKRAKGLLAAHSIDLEDVLHQTVVEAMAACLCRVGEAMPTKEHILKISRADLSFSYTSDGLLEEAKLIIIPMKKSVRDRKFDLKVPIAIPARAGPFLKCAELLWMMKALNPCVSDRLSSTPLFLRLKNLRAGSFNQCTHKWTEDRYQAKRAFLGTAYNIHNPKLYTMHTPHIAGATTLFYGDCTEAQLKAKGRWSSDIAFIYSRVCPQQERVLI